jgi:hypothetical protein
MSYLFTDATLLDFNMRKNYLGEGTNTINTIKSLSLEGVFYKVKENIDANGVKEVISGIQKDMTDFSGQYAPIIINGYNFGTGRVLRMSFPERNPIRVGSYIYDIEIIENNNFSNFSSGSSIYGNFLPNISANISEISEDIDLNFSSDQGYQYSHNLKIGINQNDRLDSQVLTEIKNIASGILTSPNIEISQISSMYSFFNSNDRRNYFNESYDLIKKICSFQKSSSSYEVPSNLKNYTNSVSHSFTLDEEGIVSLEERGEILGNNKNLTIEDYSGFLNLEIGTSFSRIQNKLNSNILKYNLGTTDSAINEPRVLTRGYDLFENKAYYNIQYTNKKDYIDYGVNAPYLLQEYQIETIKKSDGIIERNENGTIFQAGKLGTITSIINPKLLYQQAAARSLAAGCQIINSNIGFSQVSGQNQNISFYNNRIDYNIGGTNDPFINVGAAPNSPVILNILVEDQNPAEMYKEYVIANRFPKTVLLYKGMQNNMGQKNVTINGKLKRPIQNHWEQKIIFPKDMLKGLALGHLTQQKVIDILLTNADYSYDTQYNFTFTLKALYLK